MQFNRIDESAAQWPSSIHPEVQTLLKKLEEVSDAATFEIILDKPHRNLRRTVNLAFAGRKRFQLKMGDPNGKLWYVRLDPKPAPPVRRRPVVSQLTPAQSAVTS